MKCWMCGEARKFSAESVYCVMYGIIISRTHNCDRKGARLRGPDDDRGGEGNDETVLDTGKLKDFINELPEVMRQLGVDI